MTLPVVHDIHELNEYDRVLGECLNPLEDRIQGYCKELKDVLHWTAIPAAVVAVNHHFDIHTPTSSNLAVIFSLLYLADHVHQEARDQREKGVQDASFQYAILIGDYLYGRAVELLSAINGHSLLAYFSELIGILNEGHILRRLNGDKGDVTIIAKEKASFYQYAFLIAAVFGGCALAESSLFAEIGYNLGMVIALEVEGSDGARLPFLARLEELRTLIPRRRSGSNTRLRNLLNEIARGVMPRREVVAI